MVIRQDLKTLLPKNYVIHFDKEREEFYGIEEDDFSMPEKVYGSYDEDINKYLNRFRKLNKNLGILLSGIKGGGKSLMAKQFMIESKLPVLIIEQPFCGNAFNSFINSIKQEAIVFFDEFEKVYSDPKHQEELLTLFDGVLSSKKVFLLTANKDSLNEYFENRPSRIWYHKRFKNISREVLNEIIEDMLDNQEYREDVIEIVDTLGEAGKDLVISIIEEVNLSEISPKEAIKHMNIKIPQASYEFIAILKDHKDNISGVYNNHPLANESLRFNHWQHKFDYDEYISTMSQQKLNGEIHLTDKKGNKFKFYKQTDFNSLEDL